jgi:hypothetical protein
MLLRFYVLVFAFLSIATFPEAMRSDISPVTPRLTLSRSHGMRLQSGCGRLISLHAAEFPNRCDRARRAALSRYFRRPNASLKAWVTALTHSPSACPVTKFGDGCFAMPALLASLPTEKRQS